MSGIVGLVNLNGAPVDKELLGRMTDFMSFRGPDAQQIWIEGNVGFGHTMLRTTWEAQHEKQPFTLDGQVWITADARIDGRTELVASLESKLRSRLRFSAAQNEERLPCDAELILLAYEAWGDDCVDHLIGDFAFAIFDLRKQRLFCARDQLGVKPFYYSHSESCFVFSNTLDCLRRHPNVSEALNDFAIGDFLLFGFNQDTSTTSFIDIKRLPPAHRLILSRHSLQINRYWTLPVNSLIQLKKSSDYIERFKELVDLAVSDRLRTDRVTVSMSGGLDSSTVAATAKRLLAQQSTEPDVQAVTIVYDKLLPDEERYYSGVVAESIGMPINYLAADGYGFFDNFFEAKLAHPEPSDFFLPALMNDLLGKVSERSKVLLSGEGGDALMLYSWRDLVRAVNDHRILQTAKYVVWHLWAYRKVPRLGYTQTLRHWRGSKPPLKHSYPDWINDEFASRIDLKERFASINSETCSPHTSRPEAYFNFTAAPWVDCFERSDPGVTKVPVETRYPFFDLRLIDFMLRLQPIPWCVNKEILRSSIRGVLPELIRRRPKTPLKGNQIEAVVRNAQIKELEPHPSLGCYVKRDFLNRMSIEHDPGGLYLNIRPICLNYWLQSAVSGRMPTFREDSYAAR